MKKLSIAFLFLIGTCIQACNNRDENGSTDTSNTNSSKSITDSTRGNMSMNSTMSDSSQTSAGPATDEAKDFVKKASGGGMLEVQLGQLAVQKAKSQRVKNFGNMMVTDHSNANDELKSLAASKNITVPSALSPEHQKHLDMMKNKSGADFDKAYMSMMVDDHKEDIDEFKKEANSSNNDPFKSFAAKTLPVLQKHLDSAQAIHGKM